MLHLQCDTPARWLAQVDSDLPSILIDHAHCEKKAAGTALNLIFAYVENIELCREIRARGIPSKVLMLTARDSVENKIEGLDAGADDYLVKPFSFRELLARLRALTRRTEVAEPGPLVYGDVTYEPESREVRRRGDVIRLTAREGSLFELLLRRRGKVVSRSEIQARIWEDSFDLSTNIIDVYINALRRKLDAGEKEKLIQTVRGVGYRLGEPGEPSRESEG